MYFLIEINNYLQKKKALLHTKLKNQQMLENKNKIIKLRFCYCVNENDDNDEYAQHFFKIFAYF